MFQNVTVNGIGLMILVGGMTEALKALGVKGRALTLAALILGALLAIGYQVSLLDAQFRIAYEVVVYGLGSALAATGYYDLLNARLPKRTPES